MGLLENVLHAVVTCMRRELGHNSKFGFDLAMRDAPVSTVEVWPLVDCLSSSGFGSDCGEFCTSHLR